MDGDGELTHDEFDAAFAAGPHETAAAGKRPYLRRVDAAKEQRSVSYGLRLSGSSSGTVVGSRIVGPGLSVSGRAGAKS